MNKIVICIMLSIASCIKFDFVSEDEDANGIYLELTASYQLEGNEIIYEDGILFVLDHDYYNASNIFNCYISGDSIAILATYGANYTIHDFFVDDPYVYLASEQGFEIIKFTSTEAVVYSSLNIPPASIIALSDDRTYVACNSALYIINITNPRAPEIEAIMDFPFTINSLAVDTVYAFVQTDYYTLNVVNVQNPSDPVLTATLVFPAFGPYNLHVKHGCLYAFNKYDDFILIYTIESDGLNRNYSSLSLPNVYYAYIGEEYGFVLNSNELLLVDMQYTPVLAICETMYLLETPLSGVINEDTIYLLTSSKLFIAHIKTGL
ncbi:MAG: hypothetical protein JSW02_06205 [candidate division WOR-3 bacterium]|nr:MAG: hypothetical protein JSW02_06205 [candidate division WOR-3 bacterium]